MFRDFYPLVVLLLMVHLLNGIVHGVMFFIVFFRVHLTVWVVRSTRLDRETLDVMLEISVPSKYFEFIFSEFRTIVTDESVKCQIFKTFS